LDSPFIVSDNIIVNQNATLTIEPGVQVRFGQDFNITVNGGIIADGTVDRPILFTSNSPNASTGDWGTILISGTQQSSITNCIIEYGTSGITLNSGSLSLQNNVIASNLNGTVVNDGSVTIENNMIVNNTVCGINIAGGNQVTVENNTISSNGDGVVLTGNLTGTVDVTQNNIMLNSNSGIRHDYHTE
jgi:parallel beta-helix repeat protein